MAKILVVEDDQMNAKLFNLILARKGKHEVIIAKGAEDAISLGLDDSINLIIMDISLQNWLFEGKEVNGIELTVRIKSARNVPVIIATAHAMRNDRETLLKESGADDYISKPIHDQQAFLRKIEEYIPQDSGVSGRDN